MNFSRLLKKIFIRVFLIVILFPLQSCTNTLIGEKLENSFDISEGTNNPGKTNNKVQKINKKTKVIAIIKDDKKDIENDDILLVEKKSISNKGRFIEKSTKSIKKTIFNPQPYRIILRLTGANPAAPAETVTKALIKAGVQFEVEKIERINVENYSKSKSLKR